MREMTIKDQHAVEKPREKLFRYGPSRLEDFELIALLIGSGTKSEDVYALSKNILTAILNQDLNNLLTIHGVGKAKASAVMAAIELGRRLHETQTDAFALSAADVWQYLSTYRSQRKEHFIAIYLDVRNKILTNEIISVGTLTSSLVHPREVFEPAIKWGAAKIIIAHNHPSNNPTPSDDDHTVTLNLVKAGLILGIQIIDHVIITESGYYSFLERGDLTDKI